MYIYFTFIHLRNFGPWCREQLCSLNSLPPCHVAMAHREDLVCCGLSTEPFGTRHALRNPKQCARGKCGRSDGPVLVSVQNQSFQKRTFLLDSVSKTSNTSKHFGICMLLLLVGNLNKAFKTSLSVLLMHIATYILKQTSETYPPRPRRGTSFGDIPIPMQRNQNLHHKMRIMDF